MSVWHASMVREWQRLRASRWDMAMVSWVPLLSMALMCWIFASGQPYKLPVAVWNEDHSSLSRQLVRMLQAAPGLHVQQQVLNQAEAADAMERMHVYGVVHIPPRWSEQIKQGGSGTVTLLHNAQLATVSSLIQRDVQQVVGTLSAGIEMQARTKRGEPHQVVQVRMEPISTKLVALFNVSTNYEQFLAAALIPALVHILSMTAGVWAVGRELRDRTLDLWLADCRGWVDAMSALCGKLALPALTLWCSGMLCLLYLAVAKGWAVAGSMLWIALGLAALVAVSIAAGAMLAALSMSLRMALSGAGLLSAPAFAFSGVGFPLLAMSPTAQNWANAMPYTYYAKLQLAQWQMGAPVAYSAQIVSGLALAACVLLCVGGWGLVRALRRPARWGAR